MGHTPYGYKIVNGLAVIDEVEGAAVKKLYEGYLGGLGLQAAADEAGISINHCQAKRMMLNKKYLGTDYYPALITEDMMEQVRDVNALREEKERIMVTIAEDKGRLLKKEEMIQFLQEQTAELETFDDGLVRRLVEKVIVHEDGRFTVEFKSGISIVINYYNQIM